MQRLRILIGGMAVALFMVPLLAIPDEFNFGPCNPKVEGVFWLATTGTCYEVKATCKGIGGSPELVFNRSFDVFSLFTTGGDPTCSIESEDTLRAQESLKGGCKATDGAETKLELKRNDDLCTPGCEKPDKVTGCP